MNIIEYIYIMSWLFYAVRIQIHHIESQRESHEIIACLSVSHMAQAASTLAGQSAGWATAFHMRSINWCSRRLVRPRNQPNKSPIRESERPWPEKNHEKRGRNFSDPASNRNRSSCNEAFEGGKTERLKISCLSTSGWHWLVRHSQLLKVFEACKKLSRQKKLGSHGWETSGFPGLQVSPRFIQPSGAIPVSLTQVRKYRHRDLDQIRASLLKCATETENRQITCPNPGIFPILWIFDYILGCPPSQ